MSDRRTQKVTFTAKVTIVIDEQPWSPECSIEQVMSQSQQAAITKLKKLKWEDEGADSKKVPVKGITITNLKMVNVELLEAD